jgi:hypothetical protein
MSLPRFSRITLLILLFGSLLATGVQGKETPLRILVRSDDAKFIGSGVGGLEVTVRDADSGALLGGGAIEGGTGDTAGLMTTPQTRGGTDVSGDPASLELLLDIDRPTRIEVSVVGPQAVPQSRQALSTTLWLLPGQDRSTHPVVLHLNGLLIDLVATRVNADGLALTAKVVMLCGCPITAEGLWPADDYSVSAILYRDDEPVARAPLAFTGETSRFAGNIPGLPSGDLTLELQALQLSTGNAGVYREAIPQR